MNSHESSMGASAAGSRETKSRAGVGNNGQHITTGRRVFKAARWAVMNGAAAALAWYGYVEAHEPSRNVFIFFNVLAFVTSFAAFSDEVKAKVRAKGMSVPYCVSLTFDLLLAGFLAWHGAWVMAAMCVWTAGNQGLLYPEEA